MRENLFTVRGILNLLVIFATIISLTSLYSCKTMTPEIKEQPQAEKKEPLKPAKVQIETKTPYVAIQKEISGFSLKDLEEAEYTSLSAYKGNAKLIRGLFRKKNAPKSLTETMVALTNHTAFGKVSGKDGAAAILVTTTGTASFYYDLAFVIKEKGKTRNISTVPLGDRVKIKSLSIQNGLIMVDMLRHKKKEPLCCPTEDVTLKFALQNNKLTAVK
ncbi:MAG: hypothetical protein HXY52_06665 [Nitrospirae bacterium]|jgi:hypothetical protein|nr:hypothetical protein [Nitrospirota bacterium]